MEASGLPKKAHTAGLHWSPQRRISWNLPATSPREISSEVGMATISVVFSNPVGPSYSLGPLKQLHLRGRELREFRDGPVLANDDAYRWTVKDGGKYSRFDCDKECSVTLARDRDQARKTYGPFQGFSSLNGLKFVDHQLFCLYDETMKDWYGYQSGEHWDEITVVPT